VTYQFQENGAAMLYMIYEMNHAAAAPWRMAANYGHAFWTADANPLSSTEFGRSMAASLEMFERLTRRYGKPEFGIHSVPVDGEDVAVHQKTVSRSRSAGWSSSKSR
jgi:poly(3-hydroxybutyrate) depolymerase